MDISTLFGIISGIAVIVVAIFVDGGQLDQFWDLSSIMIVFGGTLAATLIHSPAKTVFGVFKATLKILFHAEKWDAYVMVKTLMRLVDKRRYHGIFSLEEDLDTIKDSFLRRGVELAIDESNAEKIRRQLHLEIKNTARRHDIGHQILLNMGSYSPAFGMMGTVIGMIMMLHGFEVGGSSLDAVSAIDSFDITAQFSQLMSGTAVALTTTFYGIVFANLVCIPLAGKMQAKNEEELFAKSIIIEGIVAIQTGEFPMDVYDKLATFFPSNERKRLRLDLNKIQTPIKS